MGPWGDLWVSEKHVSRFVLTAFYGNKNSNHFRLKLLFKNYVTSICIFYPKGTTQSIPVIEFVLTWKGSMDKCILILQSTRLVHQTSAKPC